MRTPLPGRGGQRPGLDGKSPPAGMEAIKIGLADCQPGGVEAGRAHRQMKPQVGQGEAGEVVGAALGEVGKAGAMVDLPGFGRVEIGLRQPAQRPANPRRSSRSI